LESSRILNPTISQSQKSPPESEEQVVEQQKSGMFGASSSSLAAEDETLEVPFKHSLPEKATQNIRPAGIRQPL
jgi:hypothetical protein